MANDPLRQSAIRRPTPPPERPKIWVEGDQRPPLSFRGLRTATFGLSRAMVAPLHAWTARTTRQIAVKVAGGAGRLPAGKLGRAGRFLPSHLRVAGWIKNGASVLAHASAVADPDVARGNALVAEIEPHLWPDTATPAAPAAPEAAEPPSPAEPDPSPFGADAPPVVLAEPAAAEPEPDLLAAIRGDLDDQPPTERGIRPRRAEGAAGPDRPPAPPGPVATAAIQVTGYVLGWASVGLALPLGLGQALWLWLARNVDLRRVGTGE